MIRKTLVKLTNNNYPFLSDNTIQDIDECMNSSFDCLLGEIEDIKLQSTLIGFVAGVITISGIALI